MVLWAITLNRLNFWGVINPDNTSFTHLPKAHFKDGGRSRVLTMSMRSQYSKSSEMLVACDCCFSHQSVCKVISLDLGVFQNDDLQWI